MDYRELAKVLRRGAGDDIEIAAELKAGAVEADYEGKNKHALREHARDGPRAKSMEATIPAIRESMARDLVRVVDLMRALDADEDGTVTKEEFRKVRAFPAPCHARLLRAHLRARLRASPCF